MTSIEDFSIFIESFISNKFYKSNPGLYNVVNPGPINAHDVVCLLSKYNHINKNWKFVDIESLSLRANRSNCILSDEKIKSLGLELPAARDSLEACISKIELPNV